MVWGMNVRFFARLTGDIGESGPGLTLGAGAWAQNRLHALNVPEQALRLVFGAAGVILRRHGGLSGSYAISKWRKNAMANARSQIDGNPFGGSLHSYTSTRRWKMRLNGTGVVTVQFRSSELGFPATQWEGS